MFEKEKKVVEVEEENIRLKFNLNIEITSLQNKKDVVRVKEEGEGRKTWQSSCGSVHNIWG